jgi:hypothetical protein
MTTIRAAFYARVSSEQQAAAHTIESQTAALSERAQSASAAESGRSDRDWKANLVPPSRVAHSPKPGV